MSDKKKPRKARTHARIKKDFWGNLELTASSGGEDDNEDSPQDDANRDGAADEKWYKKPIGIIILSVISGTFVLLIGLLIRHFYSSGSN